MKTENQTKAEYSLKQLEKDKIIERQLRFQDLLINISTTYINSDLSDIDKLESL